MTDAAAFASAVQDKTVSTTSVVRHRVTENHAVTTAVAVAAGPAPAEPKSAWMAPVASPNAPTTFAAIRMDVAEHAAARTEQSAVTMNVWNPQRNATLSNK